MTERLTDLATIKDWLGITGANSDSILTHILDAASQFALNYMNRDGFAATTYTENFKGNGKDAMLLHNWPLISVSSVGINGRAVLASPIGNNGLPGSGYTISDPRQAPQAVILHGSYFDLGAPCRVVYRAGFEDVEVQTLVNNSGTVSVASFSKGHWTSNVGVTLDGVAAIKVNASPSVGQYAVDSWGTYSFNVSDAGKVAAITYGYCPSDVSFGVMEIIGEWFKRKDRIGVLSKTLGGQETVSFLASDLNASVRSSLQPYRSVIPV